MIYYLIAEGWSRYNTFSPNYNYIKDKEFLEATGKVKVFCIRDDGYDDLRALLKEARPEAIVCDAVSHRHFAEFDGIRLLNMDDSHCFTKEAALISEANIAWSTAVLTPYCLSPTRQPVYHFPRNYDAKSIFSPHHVSCQPLETPPFEERDPRIMVGGAIDKRVYPLRFFASSLKNAYRPESKSIERELFMQELGKYKYGFSCIAWSGYTVAKYFEVPKAGALLVAEELPSIKERDLLGFISGVNCHLVANNKQLLKSLPTSPEIAQRGHELVMKRHTTLNRIRQAEILVEMLQKGMSLKECKTGAYIAEQLEVK